MSKVNIGQLINTIANLGVIVGLIFLGAELRQNNETLTLQQRIAAKESMDALRVEQRTNAVLNTALRKDALGEELTPGELQMLGNYLSQVADTAAWNYELSPESRADLQATLPGFCIDNLAPVMQTVLRNQMNRLKSYYPDFVDRFLTCPSTAE